MICTWSQLVTAGHSMLELVNAGFAGENEPYTSVWRTRCWGGRLDWPAGAPIGGFAKRAHPARARYLNVNLARRNRDLQPGGKEIEGGGRGGGGGGGGEK